MDGRSRGEEHGKQPVDHERRRGGPYGPKPPLNEEQRKVRAESMKEFNRLTGKNTMLGNLLSRKFRKPK